MDSYIPGDRLWVRLEGYDWWPARVLTDAEVLQLTAEPRTAGCDLAVMFYAGAQTAVSVSQLSTAAERENICFFETSSEKAVTNSDDLRAAIQNATDDSSANALKVDRTAASMVAGGVAGAGGSAAAAALRAGATEAARKAAKRARTAADERAAVPVQASVPTHRHLETEELRDLASRINEATAENDVPTLRIVLCDLDGVDVSLKDLERSRIGVAIGNILGNSSCQPLWPLARALISFWAQHLPKPTIEAIRRVQEGTRVGRGAAAGQPSFGSPTQAGGGSPTSPWSTLRQTSFGSPTTAGAATGSPTSATKPLNRSPFFRMLCQLLDSPDSTTPASQETIESVARALVTEVPMADDRSVLLSRLRNPDLAYVRENLVSGKWTAKQYVEQPEEVFVTERQKKEEARRLQEKLEALDNAKMVGINLTNLFQCSNCGGRKCSFHEQQTRGADEPTTKFITCLTCKRAWTEE